jgi:hypothetical protein
MCKFYVIIYEKISNYCQKAKLFSQCIQVENRVKAVSFLSIFVNKIYIIANINNNLSKRCKNQAIMYNTKYALYIN